MVYPDVPPCPGSVACPSLLADVAYDKQENICWGEQFFSMEAGSWGRRIVGGAMKYNSSDDG